MMYCTRGGQSISTKSKTVERNCEKDGKILTMDRHSYPHNFRIFSLNVLHNFN